MSKLSYAVWNNKGGVGKSTITFHLASRYAEKNPDKNVLIIDLCPQSNSSMMFLGGGNNGEDHVIQLCTLPTPKTVVGYISTVISGGPGAPLPNPLDFIVKPVTYNQNMPENLHLLCGDGNLEPMAPAISNAASAPALVPTIQPWVWIHEIFKKLIISLDDSRDWVVFIDTNPSFSIYTELAISAAEQLIVPVNADDSSRVATSAMFILLHGQNPPHPIYGSWTFATKAQHHGLQIPKIHVIVGNRLTQYEGAAAAFRALSDATADTLFTEFQKHPSYFTTPSYVPKSIKEFRDCFSVSLRDFNTAGVVAAHLGRSLSNLGRTGHQVHGTPVTINQEQARECANAIDDLLAKI